LAPDIDALRQSCAALLSDVPGLSRDAMLLRLEKMRRADDIVHVRGALFDVICRYHGEVVARERVASLDEQLG
jgi:hypothetical protein